jgi:hypothetical protein
MRNACVSFLTCASLAGTAGAQTYSLAASLDGSQVVPPSISGATGSGAFLLDASANTLSFSVSASVVGGPETAAHIHGPAPAGQNAPILFTLPAGNPKVGVWTYPEAVEQDILGGLTYVDVHSLEFGSGEIRGQILFVGAVPALPWPALVVLLLAVLGGGTVWVRRPAGSGYR